MATSSAFSPGTGRPAWEDRAKSRWTSSTVFRMVISVSELPTSAGLAEEASRLGPVPGNNNSESPNERMCCSMGATSAGRSLRCLLMHHIGGGMYVGLGLSLVRINGSFAEWLPPEKALDFRFV